MGEVTDSKPPKPEKNSSNPLIQACETPSIIPVLEEYRNGQDRFTIQDEGLIFSFRLSPNSLLFSNYFFSQEKSQPTPPVSTQPENLLKRVYVHNLKVEGILSHHQVSFHRHFRIFTEPFPLSLAAASEYDSDNALIPGNPIGPAGLLVVGHELGHLESFKDMFFHHRDQIRGQEEARKLLKQRQTLTPTQRNAILLEERRAWSNILNKIRPFVFAHEHRDLTKENIDGLIYKVGLDSYDRSTATLLSQNLKDA